MGFCLYARMLLRLINGSNDFFLGAIDALLCSGRIGMARLGLLLLKDNDPLWLNGNGRKEGGREGGSFGCSGPSCKGSERSI